MCSSMRSGVWVLTGGLGLILGPAVWAQPLDSPPETIQTPPAQSAPAANPEAQPPLQPSSSLPSYSGTQAAADSYRYAEQQRREAIDRQTSLNDQLSSHHWREAYPYNYYARFWVAPPANYRYPAPRLEVRAYRGIGASVSGAGYGSAALSYLGQAPRALGYVETWLGPNRYNYRPLYGPPAANPPPGSQPAALALSGSRVPPVPPPPQPEVVPPSAVPMIAGPIQPAGEPEALPAPPPQSGPREF
jgi:hypothetical protein